MNAVVRPWEGLQWAFIQGDKETFIYINRLLVGRLGLSAMVGGLFLCPPGLSAVPGLVQLSGLIYDGRGGVETVRRGFS